MLPPKGGGFAGAGVLLLGMHRSGTSVMTRLLTLLGLHGPAGHDRYEPNQSNPRGFWESVALTELDDTLLRRLGAAWDAPPKPGAVHARQAELEDALPVATRVAETVLGVGPWVWKDPRACLLLPFWDRVLGDVPVVVVHRDPVEVAQSLTARNGFPHGLGLALWERYNRELLANVRGRHVLVEEFADVLRDPHAFLVRARAHLVEGGISRLREVPHPEGLRSELLVPRSAGVQADDVGLTQQQQQLAESLRRLGGGHERFPDVLGSPESVTTGALIEMRRQALAAEATWQEQHAELQRWAEHLDGLIREQESRIDSAHEQLARQVAEAAELAGRHAGQVSRAERLDAELQELEQHCQQLQRQAEATHAELAAARAALDEVLSSRSWRWTAPARDARRRVSRSPSSGQGDDR